MKDPKYLKGIDLYNKGQYFDAHEIWEDLWNEEKGEAREFIQALIQFATAIHHFQRHNLKGAKLLFDGGMQLIKPYGIRYGGQNLERFKEQMTNCFKGIIETEEAKLPGRMDPNKEKFPVQLNEKLIPEMKLED